MQKRKRIVSMALTVAMAAALFTVNVNAARFTDVPEGHWAAAAIEELADRGVLSGVTADSFEPGRPITRAEFFTLVNRAYGFGEQAQIAFGDVAETDWFYTQVAAAVGAGYLSGYEDNTVLPNENIKRQEAAVVVNQVLGLSGGGAAEFSDVPDYWAADAIRALADRGILSGFPGGLFLPADALTRAQAAVLFAQLLADDTAVQAEAPAVGDDITLEETELADVTVTGNLTITKPGTLVENVVVMGDLVIAASVGDGNVTLKKVKVEGETHVLGGGENSVECFDCEFGKVYVSYEGGNVRVVIEGGSAAEVVFTADGKLEIRGEGAVESVVIADNLDKDAKIAIEGDVAKITVDAPVALSVAGNVGSIDLQAAGTLKLESGSAVGTLNVTENAAGAKVDIPKDAKVDEANVDAKTAFTGAGSPETATITAEGVTAQTAPKELGEGSKETSKPSSGGGAVAPPPKNTPPPAPVAKIPEHIQITALNSALVDPTYKVTGSTPTSKGDRTATFTIGGNIAAPENDFTSQIGSTATNGDAAGFGVDGVGLPLMSTGSSIYPVNTIKSGRFTVLSINMYTVLTQDFGLAPTADIYIRQSNSILAEIPAYASDPRIDQTTGVKNSSCQLSVFSNDLFTFLLLDSEQSNPNVKFEIWGGTSASGSPLLTVNVVSGLIVNAAWYAYTP